MAEYIVQDTTLTAIADAVRAKKGTTEPIALTDFAAEIESIQSGGGSGENKLALVVGAQSADNPYDITASDLEGVTEIKQYTFYGANGLISIELPTTCTSIGTSAFYGCSLLPSVDMPKVTSIGNRTFYGCEALPSVEMPNVISIGDSAFRSCSALTSVSMPNVTSIGNDAFRICSSLTSLTIPSTCTGIGTYALQCGTTTNKCTFTFEATTPPTISSRTFDGSKINKIIVPVGCGETYKTATNWTTVADYIVEATE